MAKEIAPQKGVTRCLPSHPVGSPCLQLLLNVAQVVTTTLYMPVATIYLSCRFPQPLKMTSPWSLPANKVPYTRQQCCPGKVLRRSPEDVPKVGPFSPERMASGKVLGGIQEAIGDAFPGDKYDHCIGTVQGRRKTEFQQLGDCMVLRYPEDVHIILQRVNHGQKPQEPTGEICVTECHGWDWVRPVTAFGNREQV